MKGADVLTPFCKLAERHKTIVRFALFQLFVMIYFQKISIGPSSFQISLPMLITMVSIAWMLIRRKVAISATKLGFYLLFVSCCLFSQVPIGLGSVPSFVQVILLYGSLTLASDLPDLDYQHHVLGGFVKLMILPAWIVLIQYTFQKTTGLADPIDMNAILPKVMLLQGYSYNTPYPVWTAVFSRPNGFFFLEPSTVSLSTACAAVIEITYSKRFHYIILMISATIFSIGGTGFTLLLISMPILLAPKLPLRIVIFICFVLAVGIIVALLLDLPLPLLSRLDELNHEDYSGSQRLLIPATQLLTFLSDWSYFLTGAGAGSTGIDLGNPWPVLKVLKEYGLMTMVAFILFYFSALTSNNSSVALKVALSVIFHFTGGYLVSPFMVDFLAIICMNCSRRGSATEAKMTVNG